MHSPQVPRVPRHQKGFAVYIALLAVLAVAVGVVSLIQLYQAPSVSNLYQAAIVSNTQAPAAVSTATPNPSPITFVQQASKEASTTSTLKLAYPNPQAQGDLNVVIIGWHGVASYVNSVTDALGNTYRLAIATQGTNLSQSIYYAKNIKAGNNTVTAAFNGSVVTPSIVVLEYSGADASNPLDVTNGQAGGSVVTADSGFGASIAANDLVVGAGTTNVKFTGANSYSIARVISNPHGWLIAEDRVASTLSPYHETANLSTSSGSYYVMQLASFRSAPLPTPTLTPPPTPTPTPSGTACKPDTQVPPRWYCARTDLNVAPLPATVPNMGGSFGAGTIVTDPAFGSRIVRVTDATTNSAVVFDTPSSADHNIWNTKSTLFTLYDIGGASYVFTFNPATLKASPIYGGYQIPTATDYWSRTNPNLLYVQSGTVLNKYCFADLVSGVCPSGTAPDLTTPPSLANGRISTIFDFAAGSNCLGASYKSIWHSSGLTPSIGDAAFGAAFSSVGVQNTGFDAVVYTVGKGCTHINTKTRQVTSDWIPGCTGKTPCNWKGTTDSFGLHEMQMTLNPDFIQLGWGSCLSTTCENRGLPYLFQLSTLTMAVCKTGGNCGGHSANGYSHALNESQASFADEISIRSYSDYNTATDISSITQTPLGLLDPFDQHFSWNADSDAKDTALIFTSTFSTGSAGSPTYNGIDRDFPSAWYQEIMGINPQTGVVSRFAHNFVVGDNQRFPPSAGIGNVSQDGRFYAFSSDWGGTLGTEDGTSSACIPGGPKWNTAFAYPQKTLIGGTYYIRPTSNNTGNYVFKVTVTGTSGAAEPAWPQTIGRTVKDGTVTWTNAGKRNCRGDVFVVELR
jgi:hypothetical protein